MRTHTLHIRAATLADIAKRRPRVAALSLATARAGDTVHLVEVDGAGAATGRFLDAKIRVVLRGKPIARGHVVVGLDDWPRIQDPKAEAEAAAKALEAERRRREPATWTIEREKEFARIRCFGCRGTVSLHATTGAPTEVTFYASERHLDDVEKGAKAIEAFIRLHFGAQYTLDEPERVPSDDGDCTCDGDGPKDLVFAVSATGWNTHRIDGDLWPEVDGTMPDVWGRHTLADYARMARIAPHEMPRYRLAALGRPAIRGPLGPYPTGTPVLFEPGADHFYVCRPPVLR